MRNLIKFKSHLRNNTSLGDRTISLYLRTVKRFFKQYQDPSIENINKFVSESFRSKHSFYVKYCFRPYLEMIGRPNDYYKLVRVRYKPKKSQGVYLPLSELERIVSMMSPDYRLVALIQNKTGLRAGDVFMIKAKNVSLETSPGEKYLKIVTTVKGEKSHTTFVFGPEIFKILDHVKKCGKEYPFIRGSIDNLTRAVDNNSRYYSEEIKRVVKPLGFPDFTSHDFRRNFIDDVLSITQDLKKAQGAVGHANEMTTLRYVNKKRKDSSTKDTIKQVRS